MKRCDLKAPNGGINQDPSPPPRLLPPPGSGLRVKGLGWGCMGVGGRGGILRGAMMVVSEVSRDCYY